MKSSIEIIDFKSNSAPKKFINSLKNTGFAVVMNHGISSTLIDDVYLEWSDFFSSKDKYNYMYDLEKRIHNLFEVYRILYQSFKL